jgi:hypothetical protein
MNFNLSFHLTNHWLIALASLAVLIAAIEIGYRSGIRKRGMPDSDRSLMSGTGAAMLGLMGLLLGFTLSMGIGRWDDRRAIIIDESNAIGTLWLRAGFIEEPVRSQLRGTLHEYTESRIVLGGSRDDLEKWRAARNRSEMLHAEIWSAIEHAQGAELSNATVSSLITAANGLIDIHEIRLASIDNYLPASLMMLLLGVAAVAVSFVAWSFGAGTHDSRKAILMLGVLIASVLLLIMDVNRPQRGLVSVGVGPLERVQKSMADFQAQQTRFDKENESQE